MNLTKKNFVLVIILVIIISMSVETWGQMAKSSDDAEKVEEAISRLIAEHEADPSAHLGAGESLEAHRANEVIDHPASSIVADKLSFNEYVLSMPFTTLDGIFNGGGVDVLFPQLTIWADWEMPQISYVYFYRPTLGVQDLRQYEFILRQLVRTEQYGTDNFFQFGLMYYTNLKTSTKIIDGLYFSLEDGVLRGRFHLGAYDYFVNLVTPDEISGPDVWNLAYSPIDKIARFYINGEEKGTLDLSAVSVEITAPYIGWRCYADDEANQMSNAVDLFFYSLRLVG